MGWSAARQFGATTGEQFTALALQSLDPSVVTGMPVILRALLAFGLTLLFGGVVIYRYGDRIDQAVDASRANPFLSMLYGLVAYGLVTFFVVYAYSEITRLGIATTSLTILSAAVLAVVLLSLGGLGFVVVGAWATRLAGTRDLWRGLVAVGAVGAIVWLVLPFFLAVIVWFGIAAVGIGGPTRKWVHHSAEPTAD